MIEGEERNERRRRRRRRMLGNWRQRSHPLQRSAGCSTPNSLLREIHSLNVLLYLISTQLMPDRPRKALLWNNESFDWGWTNWQNITKTIKRPSLHPNTWHSSSLISAMQHSTLCGPDVAKTDRCCCQKANCFSNRPDNSYLAHSAPSISSLSPSDKRCSLRNGARAWQSEHQNCCCRYIEQQMVSLAREKVLRPW